MPDQKELPRYKCHKTVSALKIAEIQYRTAPGTNTAQVGHGAILVPDDPGYSILVSEDYVSKHRPQVGGYFVRYDDGYESFSPAKAFEDGYATLPPAGSIELLFNGKQPPDAMASIVKLPAGALDADQIANQIGRRIKQCPECVAKLLNRETTMVFALI